MFWNFLFITRFDCVTAQAVIRKRSQEGQFGTCGGQNGNGIVFYAFSHHSLNTIATQSKNCPFVVHSTYIRHNGIKRGMFQLTSVPVFSDVVVTLLSLIAVLPPSGNFWTVTVLFSARDKFPLNITPRMFHLLHSHPVLVLQTQQLL